jgi:hypothetical protein
MLGPSSKQGRVFVCMIVSSKQCGRFGPVAQAFMWWMGICCTTAVVSVQPPTIVCLFVARALYACVAVCIVLHAKPAVMRDARCLSGGKG